MAAWRPAPPLLESYVVPVSSRLRRWRVSSWASGPLAIGAGLAVLGVTVYVFLVLSARAVGPERYSALSAMWALVFLVCGGVFLPVEQEVTRIVVGLRATGAGAGPLFRRAVCAAAGLASGIAALALLFEGPMVHDLFDNQVLVLVGFVLAVAGYATEYLVRGILAGSERFAAYGRVLAAEGVARLLAAAVLVISGVRTAGPLAIVIGLTPFVAAAPVAFAERDLLGGGPRPPWRQMSRSLGYLLVGSLLAQVLIHVGPLAVKLLAGGDAGEVTGRFFAGLLLTRAPLFLFLAVQASLLPRLTALCAAGRRAEFATTVNRLLAASALLGIVTVVGALLLGQPALTLLFGPRFHLGGRDLALMSASTSGIMVALVLVQALVALERPRDVALSWLLGVVGFGAVVAVGDDPVLRVELALLGGAVVAACCAAVLVRAGMRDNLAGKSGATPVPVLSTD